MSDLKIHLFNALEDNYGVLIHDPTANVTASIDAPDADAVKTALSETGWTLTHILVTHHHADHTQGIVPLRNEYQCKVIGPVGQIKGIDEHVKDGDAFRFGEFDVIVIGTPGHTLDHITLYLPAADVVFCADTVFPLGCGRVFEGTMAQMWDSVSKIAKLPSKTIVYSGHEYTLGNAKFAETIETDNADLKAYIEDAKAKRARGEPTVPTTVDAERKANPFMRADQPELAAALGMVGAAPEDVFAEIRRRKDNF